MKNKLVATLTMLFLIGTLSVTAIAQGKMQGSKFDPHPSTDSKPKIIKGPKIDFGTRVNLLCEGVAGGDVVSAVRVTNRTVEAIPSLTMIYVDTPNGKAHEALRAALPRRGTAIIHTPKGGQPKSCQAWFFKK